MVGAHVLRERVNIGGFSFDPFNPRRVINAHVGLDQLYPLIVQFPNVLDRNTDRSPGKKPVSIGFGGSAVIEECDPSSA